MDLDFLERVYRRLRGTSFRLLREDFCGTAWLAAEWVLRGPEHRAVAVDLDAEPLAWARRHRVPRMREAARRLTLLRRDVRAVTRPRVDIVAALNFSYWVFKQREELRRYFRAARRALRPRGLLVVNAFGGTEAMDRLLETRRIPPGRAPDGLRMPGFLYQWEHARFNPVTHELLCHMHFKFYDGTAWRRAFSYDWRLWTLPEIREVMREAGFAGTEVHVGGWDEVAQRHTDLYYRRDRFENQTGWLAYVVGIAGPAPAS
jgi:SAM-dependent methyltransferase